MPTPNTPASPGAHNQTSPSIQASPGNERADENSTVQEAADVARESKDELAQQASRAKDRVIRQGQDLANEQKGRAAEQVHVFGSAVREAATKLEEEGQSSVAGYAEACADELDRAAGYLRGRNFGELYHDANRVARRNPELFLGGMFVAGLALSRFLKASSDAAVANDNENSYSRLTADDAEGTDQRNVIVDNDEFTKPLSETSEAGPQRSGASAPQAATTPTSSASVPSRPR